MYPEKGKLHMYTPWWLGYLTTCLDLVLVLILFFVFDLEYLAKIILNCSNTIFKINNITHICKSILHKQDNDSIFHCLSMTFL